MICSKKTGRNTSICLASCNFDSSLTPRYQELSPSEPLIDNLNIQGLEQTLAQRRQKTDVMELEDWKRRIRKQTQSGQTHSSEDFKLASVVKHLSFLNSSQKEQLKDLFQRFKL